MSMEIKKDNAQELEQKKIISWLQNKLVLNGVIFVIFIIFFFVKVSPWFTQYSEQKDILMQKIEAFHSVSKDGNSFADFSALVTDEELKKMIGKIGEDFYSKNLKNTSSLPYADFVKEKTEYINKIKTSDKIKTRDKKLSTVLPSYQEWVSVEGTMSDLDFINYIENLLKAFSLQTTSNIGINDIVLLEDKGEKIKKIDALSSQLFYIPLKLDLRGRKADIADFLYYLQNVGKVEKVENDDIKFYADNYITKKIPNFNNIYESKLVDIESITLPEYIDTSSVIRPSDAKSTEKFLLFIRNGVENEDVFSVNVELRFYVKGLPVYKLEEYILKIVGEYKKMKTDVEKKLNEAQNRKSVLLNTEILSVISSFKTIKLYLADLDETVKRLEAGLKQKNNLEKLYLDASKVKYDLWNISEILTKNIQNLDKNNKAKK